MNEVINNHKNEVTIIGKIAKGPETFHVKATGELIAKIGVRVMAPTGRAWIDVKGYGPSAEVIIRTAKIGKTVMVEGSLIIENKTTGRDRFINPYVKAHKTRIIEAIPEPDTTNPIINNPL